MKFVKTSPIQFPFSIPSAYAKPIPNKDKVKSRVLSRGPSSSLLDTSRHSLSKFYPLISLSRSQLPEPVSEWWFFAFCLDYSFPSFLREYRSFKERVIYIYI